MKVKGIKKLTFHGIAHLRNDFGFQWDRQLERYACKRYGGALTLKYAGTPSQIERTSAGDSTGQVPGSGILMA
jgi:hypothetical protein